MKCFVDPGSGLVVDFYDDDAPVACPDHLVEVILPRGVALEEIRDDAPAVDGGSEAGRTGAVLDYAIPEGVARDACAALIEKVHTEALASITRGASAEEIGTWLPKKSWAVAAKDPANPDHSAAVAALAGMVPDLEALKLGLNSSAARAQHMADRILSMAAIYEAAIIQVEKARREAYTALAATPDDDTALLALMATIREEAAARLAQFKEAMGI